MRLVHRDQVSLTNTDTPRTGNFVWDQALHDRNWSLAIYYHLQAYPRLMAHVAKIEHGPSNIFTVYEGMIPAPFAVLTFKTKAHPTPNEAIADFRSLLLYLARYLRHGRSSTESSGTGPEGADNRPN